MSEGSRTSVAAAFRSRDFRLYQAARLAVVTGAEAQAVAVAWQVYQITHRAIDLGYTGLALFLPGLFFLLPSGHIADRFDRRQVVLVCYSLQALCTATLLYFAWHGMTRVMPIYAVLFLIGTGRSFSGPASSALIPQLVPTEDFVNAVTWGASIFQIATVVGPSIGGILFTLPLQAWAGTGQAGHLAGAGIVYLFCLVTLLWYVVLISMLQVRPGRMEKKAISADVILAGVRYVWNKQVLLGSISLDLFAVLLGGSGGAAADLRSPDSSYGAEGAGAAAGGARDRCAMRVVVADGAAATGPGRGTDAGLLRHLWSDDGSLWPLQVAGGLDRRVAGAWRL